MSKYCLLHDQPKNENSGCTIFGVHHDCEKCPNLIEMGEESITYNEQKAKEE